MLSGVNAALFFHNTFRNIHGWRTAVNAVRRNHSVAADADTAVGVGGGYLNYNRTSCMMWWRTTQSGVDN